jgi:hypothetical protein
VNALLILNLCDRWHKLPSEVLAEDADVLRMLHMEEIERARIEREEGDDG